jgi:hypothetical protein
MGTLLCLVACLAIEPDGDWWSLRPVVRPALPHASDAERQHTPIDSFLLERLEREGLGYSTPADRATLIRRVTFDLHGLPPTYEDVQAFMRDTGADAYDRLVDRLLASPRYGERWGRHWLDVARFAESNGFERDRIRPNFWPYRDYVIAAFNRDLPYNQFVREQLAGDAVRPGDPDALVATGFLVAGPKNDVDTISALERMITRQDELDEFVAATGTTFLGLTIGCARCHDHKFDPIRSSEYYALAAVFSGLDRADNVIAPPDQRSRHETAVRDAQQRIDAVKAQTKLLLDPVRRRTLAQRSAKVPVPADGKLPMAAIDQNEDTFDPVFARFVRLTVSATSSGNEPCIDELEVYGDDKDNLALSSAGAKASASSLLPGYPIHQVHHLNDGKYGNSFSWISNEPGKGWAQVELAEPAAIRRVTWARDREAKFTDRLPIDYRLEVSLDGRTWTEVSSSRRRQPFEKAAARGSEVAIDELLAALTSDERTRHTKLTAELAEADADLRRIPPLPVSYSVRDGTPRETFVLRRGNVRDRAERVQPAGLAAVTAIPRNLLPADADSGPERRRLLADWIVDPRNPLAARVMVNRVWHYHFGRGIVSTPSDFGASGDRPSHPELLDWLAADFVEHGWSVKRLHRLIVLSEAYRQSSGQNPAAAAVDAENRLLWRMNTRRLESESLRDAVLFAATNLDFTQGGPGFRLFDYRDGNVPDYLLRDGPGPETWRRGVYMFNIRTFQEPLMSAFDCPDPSVQTPRRERSTTAVQALSLMNNTFVLTQADHLARRIHSAGPYTDPTDEVVWAYRLTLSRDPSARQRAEAADFVRRHDLATLCRVLFNTNEFLYIR